MGTGEGLTQEALLKSHPCRSNMDQNWPGWGCSLEKSFTSWFVLLGAGRLGAKGSDSAGLFFQLIPLQDERMLRVTAKGRLSIKGVFSSTGGIHGVRVGSPAHSLPPE